MILLVTGTRDGVPWNVLEEHLVPRLKDTSLLVQGGAKGVDAQADHLARRVGVHVARVDALWSWFGKPAGGQRNQAMLLLRPDLCLAFPGPKSRGT